MMLNVGFILFIVTWTQSESGWLLFVGHAINTSVSMPSQFSAILCMRGWNFTTSLDWCLFYNSSAFHSISITRRKISGKHQLQTIQVYDVFSFKVFQVCSVRYPKARAIAWNVLESRAPQWQTTQKQVTHYPPVFSSSHLIIQ